MERFVKGDVVVIPFPFSDMISSKRRPALVVASGDFDDVILCQITSKSNDNKSSIKLELADFDIGKLKITSYVRIRRIFTSDAGQILYRIGTLNKTKIRVIEDAICDAMRG